MPGFSPAAPPYLVAGHAAAITAGAAALGVIGQLAPAIADGRGAPRQDAIFVAEMDLDAAWAARSERGDAVQPLPRHPFVVRDLSIVVDDALPAEIIRGNILAAGAAAPARWSAFACSIVRGQGRAERPSQPLAAADVPGAGAR
jgi:phenylalanyl-tRNA synthetase beta chain